MPPHLTAYDAMPPGESSGVSELKVLHSNGCSSSIPRLSASKNSFGTRVGIRWSCLWVSLDSDMDVSVPAIPHTCTSWRPWFWALDPIPIIGLWPLIIPCTKGVWLEMIKLLQLIIPGSKPLRLETTEAKVDGCWALPDAPDNKMLEVSTNVASFEKPSLLEAGFRSTNRTDDFEDPASSTSMESWRAWIWVWNLTTRAALWRFTQLPSTLATVELQTAHGVGG